MFLIPIQEDKTRIFITFKSNDDYKMLKWYKKLPIWFRHSLNNRFLDSDTFLLHKQEKYLQENNKTYHENKEYYMPATSDKSIFSCSLCICKIIYHPSSIIRSIRSK